MPQITTPTKLRLTTAARTQVATKKQETNLSSLVLFLMVIVYTRQGRGLASVEMGPVGLLELWVPF